VNQGNASFSVPKENRRRDRQGRIRLFTDALFQRFPGVEGSLYFVGGFGVNYLQRDGISLAPLRFGVGWRQDIGVGYMHFTRNKRLNPL
jgi:hypothetical protein